MGIAGTHVAYAEGPETAAQTAAVVEKVAHSPSEAAAATSVDRSSEAKAEYAIESDIMIGEEAQDAALSEEGDASEAAASEKETASENVSEEWEIAGDEVVVQVEKAASDNADKTDKSVEKRTKKAASAAIERDRETLFAEADVDAAEPAATPRVAMRRAARPVVVAAAQPAITSETGLEIGEEKTPEALQAPQKATDTNYAEDERIVGFYKDTQLERGNGPAASYSPSTKENEFVDGFRYKTLEPSETSDDKTLWGFEIEFDRDEGQRTYTDFYFTNSINVGRNELVKIEKLPGNDIGKKLSEKGDFKEVNYKAKTVTDVSASGSLRNFNTYGEKEDLEYINSINNKNTMMAWESNYTKDNANGPKATHGDNVTFGFTVNPWPNENDMLNLIYLNGDYDKKEFVKGQEINTGIKVENLDENARKRLVGQVYHPVSGDVVPGAEAYIDENDMVVVKMPEGALKKDANGKTVINEDSIFSKAGYKNIQSLDVKFFARPRTKAEFEAIAGENYGTYTETGAGTATINHKGQDVVIDKQGIARYDHYNKVGEFKINLDDTMYYNQRFEDGNGDDTTKITSSAVQPEVPFEVKIVPPANPGETDKSAADMNGLKTGEKLPVNLTWTYLKKKI